VIYFQEYACFTYAWNGGLLMGCTIPMYIPQHEALCPGNRLLSDKNIADFHIGQCLMRKSIFII